MAPGVKAKVMYCKTGQISQKNYQNGQYPLAWCCNVVFTRHPTIENQSHGITYRTSLEPPTADGHLAVGHGRYHRVSRNLICRYLPPLNSLSQIDSNRGAPNMVMIHGLSASTISDLGVPRFETKPHVRLQQSIQCTMFVQFPRRMVCNHDSACRWLAWRVIRRNLSGC